MDNYFNGCTICPRPGNRISRSEKSIWEQHGAFQRYEIDSIRETPATTHSPKPKLILNGVSNHCCQKRHWRGKGDISRCLPAQLHWRGVMSYSHKGGWYGGPSACRTLFNPKVFALESLKLPMQRLAVRTKQSDPRDLPSVHSFVAHPRRRSSTATLIILWAP